jgi:hypothetical protein
MTTSERQLSWVWGGLVLATTALVPVWTFVVPWLRPCIFRKLTGIPCPTCGATRGVLALMDGRVFDAFFLNPLVAISALVFLVGGVVAPIWAWRSGKFPLFAVPIPIWLRISIVALILLNWIWLIASQ